MYSASLANLYVQSQTDDKMREQLPPRSVQYLARGTELPTYISFIDTYLVPCDHGRIGKDEMFRVASSHLEIDKIVMKDMITNLVQNGVMYNRNDSLLNIKGVFIGYQWNSVVGAQVQAHTHAHFYP